MLTSNTLSDIIDINGTIKGLQRPMEQVLFRLPPDIKEEFDRVRYNLRLTQQEVLTTLVLRFISEAKDKEAP